MKDQKGDACYRGSNGRVTPLRSYVWLAELCHFLATSITRGTEQRNVKALVSPEKYKAELQFECLIRTLDLKVSPFSVLHRDKVLSDVPHSDLDKTCPLRERPQGHKNGDLRTR